MWRLPFLAAILAAFCFSSVAHAEEPNFQAFYSSGNNAGVYWQEGATADNIFAREKLLLVIEKGYKSCQAQFNSSQIKAGEHCVVRVELVLPKGGPDVDLLAITHDVQVAMHVLFGLNGIIPAEAVDASASKGAAPLGPAAMAYAYQSGGKGVNNPGLFFYVAKAIQKQ